MKSIRTLAYALTLVLGIVIGFFGDSYIWSLELQNKAEANLRDSPTTHASPGGMAFGGTEFTLPSKVRVKIVESAFGKSSADIVGCTTEDGECRIDGHVPFGIGFGLPKTYVKAITVSYEGRSFNLDSSDMYNAWGDRPFEVKGVIRYFGGSCADPKNCQFRGLFGDGAASFVAEWRVVDGLSVRTVLTDSDDVVALFRRQIDPPRDPE